MKQKPLKSSLPAWMPEALRQDPKKAGILGALVLVLVIATLRWLLMGGGPAKAQAHLKPPPSPAKATANKKKGVGHFETRTASGSTRNWLKTPVQDVSRNLFATRHEFFPQAGRTSENAAASGNAATQPTFWDSIQKSRDQAADQKRRREILVDNLQREAAKLRLQSTVMGPEPQAIIGGSLVKEGDNVSASSGAAAGIRFRVLVIEARRVIIEHEGIKLEVRMAQ